MRSPVMIIVEVSGKDVLEMAFVQHDDMIKAVASQGSDESLHERVLPRTSRCTQDLLDSHTSDPPLKFAAVDCIAIAQEVFRCGVPRKGFDDLLTRPLRSRTLGDIEMNHLSSRMCEHDQHEK